MTIYNPDSQWMLTIGFDSGVFTFSMLRFMTHASMTHVVSITNMFTVSPFTNRFANAKHGTDRIIQVLMSINGCIIHVLTCTNGRIIQVSTCTNGRFREVPMTTITQSSLGQCHAICRQA